MQPGKSTPSVQIQISAACKAIPLISTTKLRTLLVIRLAHYWRVLCGSTKEWYDYLKRERSKARYMGLHQEFISPKELGDRHPLIDAKHYYAALWDEQDGDLDPLGRPAFAKSARVHGRNILPIAASLGDPAA